MVRHAYLTTLLTKPSSSTTTPSSATSILLNINHWEHQQQGTCHRTYLKHASLFSYIDVRFNTRWYNSVSLIHSTNFVGILFFSILTICLSNKATTTKRFYWWINNSLEEPCWVISVLSVLSWILWTDPVCEDRSIALLKLLKADDTLYLKTACI